MTRQLGKFWLFHSVILPVAVILSLGFVAVAEAQQLKGKSRTVRYDGCCTHCSSSVCSGCSSSLTGICQVGAFKANCVTQDDKTHCVPAKATQKGKMKAN